MSVCPNCKQMNPPASKFCDECGVDLPASALPVPAFPGARFVTIGREHGNDVVLAEAHAQVSRRHARVAVAGSRLTIEDLGSANGTFVNGQRIVGPTPFGLYDELRFGSYRLNMALLQPHVSPTDPGAMPGRAARHGAAPARPTAPAPPVAMAHVAQGPYAAQQQVVVLAPGLGMPGWVHNVPGKIREPILIIFLWFITLGIYGFYWAWVTLDDLKRWRGGMGWSGAMMLLAFVPFVNVAVIAVPFLIPSYIGDLYRRDRRTPPVSGLLGLLVLVPAVLLPAGLVLGASAGGLGGAMVGYAIGGVASLVCGFIWVVAVQNALNDFWRTKGAVG